MRSTESYQPRLAVGPKPSGFTTIGIFLFFGAVMASLAAATLLWRGTALDRVWVFNPTAYMQLAPLGRAVGILFLLLGVALITGRNRVVPTPPLGMETSGRNHLHAGSRGCR